MCKLTKYMHLSLGKSAPGSPGLAEQDHGGFLPLAALLLLWEGKGFGFGPEGPEGQELHNRGIDWAKIGYGDFSKQITYQGLVW